MRPHGSRARLRSLRTALACAVLALVGRLPAAAQVPPTVEAARRLRDSGAYGAAADTLETYLAEHPDDGGVRWMRAQLLYWAGRTAEARRAYEAAAALVPDDPWLRIEYAEVLEAVGELGAARGVLLAVADGSDQPEAVTEALVRLGSLAHRHGDDADAVRRFEEALARDPANRVSADMLEEIRAGIRPWVRSELMIRDDNQPFRRLGARMEGGWFLTPVWTAAVRGSARHLEQGTGGNPIDLSVELAGYLPAAHLSVAGWGGGAWGASGEGGGSWTGGAETALRLPGQLSLGARVGRERYLSTVTSIDTLLVTESLELSLSRANASTWAGEAVVRRERFPDGNDVRTAYLWVLAPLTSFLRVGYAFSWQDADESRWSPESADEGSPGSGPGTGSTPDPAAARYDPYYTPEEVLSHSGLAEVRGTLGRWRVSVSAAGGFHARERAPFLDTSPRPGEPPSTRVSFYRREFTPWRASLSASAPLTPSVILAAEAERRSTVFFAESRVSLSVTYRLAGEGPSRGG